MKNKSLVFMVLFGAVASFFAFASEELDIYTNIYRNAMTWNERLNILRDVSSSNLDGVGQLYAEALSQLILEQPNLQTTAEKTAADESARLLANLLGDAKYTGAAGDLWKVVQNFSNPLVKADALIALGRVRGTDYLEQVVKILTDLNLSPTSDPESGQKIAYGAILALEKYKDPSGYLPVFFASTGWYNRRVKDQAVASLPYIIDDPSEPLSSILKSSGYSYDTKLLALQKEEESKAPPSSKATVAVLALSEGWKAATNDVKQRMQLANMRKLSIDMIKRYGSADPAAIPLLGQSYTMGIDSEERLSSVAALAAIGSDAAARTLANFLLDLNKKRQDGNITAEDERMVRAVIPALGSTAKPIARTALRMVENVDWTNAVKVLAAEALKKIP